MNISTRTALASDKPAIWQLYESAMRHHIDAIWGWNPAWQATHFDEAFASSTTCIVEVDGGFSGYVQLDRGPVDYYLRMIVLAPGCRSLGIGAKLLADMLSISRDDGRSLYLRVFRTNGAALRFYEREGWFVAADEGNFKLMRHETSMAHSPTPAANGNLPMIIRSTREEDWEVLKDMRLASLLDAPTAFGVSHANAAAQGDAAWRERASNRGQAQFLLAFIDGAPVGIVGAVETAPSDLNLIAMWVRPECRGTGAAAGLVDAVKQRAVAQGHARVVLDVSPANARAAAFYRKQGFAFLQDREPLASHPEITVQKMAWHSGISQSASSD